MLPDEGRRSSSLGVTPGPGEHAKKLQLRYVLVLKISEYTSFHSKVFSILFIEDSQYFLSEEWDHNVGLRKDALARSRDTTRGGDPPPSTNVGR